MKIFLSLFIVLSLCSVVYSDKKEYSDEEIQLLMKKIEAEHEKQRVLDIEKVRLIQIQKDEKAKTEAVMKLGRTVDKLAKTLEVDE